MMTASETRTAPSDTLISETLTRLAADAPSEEVSLQWIMTQLKERAFGLILLILALPCCIPFLYGIPQVVALPLMFVAAQLLLGRRAPWLPQRLAQRTVTRQSLASLALRAAPWLRRIELLSYPRLSFLTHAPIDRLVGATLVIFAASILVPLPLTNSVPALAIVIISMGLLGRDGLLVLAGMLLGTAWIASLIFAGASLISLLRGWMGV